MTKYKVLLSETAVAQLDLLESKQKNRVKEPLRTLEEDPFRNRPRTDIKKLRYPSDPPLFRLRIGNYRAIYFVVKNEVKVTEIIHQSKGYDWLN
ncbi:MAG: type II toxin-antitoxin system RelE family toxin [Promethearchaeia archaeon]